MRFSTAAPATADPAATAYSLEFDPRLVEESVLLAIDRAALATRRRFRHRRDPLYEIEQPERRESAFNELSRRWFVRLELGDPVRQALAREPSIAAGTAKCLVVPVVKARQEYADLKPDLDDEGLPVLLLCLRASTLVDRDRLVPFLRHDLLHIADMLDSDFGFDPQLPTLDDSAALDNLLRQRYQTLWDTTIDGRLLARSELPAAAEAARRHEFLGVFSMLGEGGERWFQRFLRGPRPSHAALVGFAAEPGQSGTGPAHNRCPVCRMPTATLHPNPSGLEERTVRAIQRDLPNWHPGRGLCLQCADLYAVTPA
ncbi:MAG: hypothetical protein ACE5EG_01410 [Thermoanaerobaculia bacterium]